MKVLVKKLLNGALAPIDEDEARKLNLVKREDLLEVDIAIKRNGPFHRKRMALIRYAFDNWDMPDSENLYYKGQLVQKDFDEFRKDVEILSGNFDVVAHHNHITHVTSLKKVARSISYANMEQHVFDELFSATINAILEHFLTNHDEATLRANVEEVLRYG